MYNYKFILIAVVILFYLLSFFPCLNQLEHHYIAGAHSFKYFLLIIDV